MKELRDKAGRVRGRRAVAEVALVIAVSVLCVWGAWLLGIALVPGPVPLTWGDWTLFGVVDGLSLGMLCAGVISLLKRPVRAPRGWWQGFEPGQLSPREALEYLGTVAPARLLPAVDRSGLADQLLGGRIAELVFVESPSEQAAERELEVYGAGAPERGPGPSISGDRPRA